MPQRTFVDSQLPQPRLRGLMDPVLRRGARAGCLAQLFQLLFPRLLLATLAVFAATLEVSNVRPD